MASLRDRKKARTRAELRQHALRLFAERGYDATTVDDIADAAVVSRSTFFRYFGSKEDVVLADDDDERFRDAFAAQPPGTALLDALTGALRAAVSDLDEAELEREETRMALIRSVPALERVHQARSARDVQDVARLIAPAVGCDAHDPEVLVFAGIFAGVRLAARVHTGYESGSGYIDTALSMLGLLRHGVPLAARPIRPPADR